MRKYVVILIMILVIGLSACGVSFEKTVDEVIQNYEIDHFEQVYDYDINIIVGSETLPDFESFVNRVDKDGTVQTTTGFTASTEEIDVNTVGEYEVIYSFTSFEEAVVLRIPVYVVAREKEDVIEMVEFNRTSNSISVSFLLVESDYSIAVTKIRIYEESNNNQIMSLTSFEDYYDIGFTDLEYDMEYLIKVFFDDGSTYDFTSENQDEFYKFEVLPTLEKTDSLVPNLIYGFTGTTITEVIVVEGKGYIYTAEFTGYDSTVIYIIGIDLNGIITGYETVAQGETPGFGAEIAKDWYKNQFQGVDITDISSIDGSAGATLTFSAHLTSLNKLIDFHTRTFID